MTWLRIDDSMPDHPKIVGLSDCAFRAHVEGLCYCAKHLTDGFIPAPAAAKIAPKRALAELQKARLWTRKRGGFCVTNYLEYNPSREKVEAERAQRSQKARVAADARWHARSNAPSIDITDAPVPSRPLDQNNNQEDSDDGATRTLLEAMGEHEQSQAHLELLAWRARGCSEFDFRSVARAVEKKRPKNPRSYVVASLRNRLAEPA